MQIIAIGSKAYKWFFTTKNLMLKLNLSFLGSKPKNHSPSLSASLPTESSSSVASDEKLAKVFDHFDTNKDGKISADELQAYFMSIGEPMSINEAQTVIKELDNDGDNLLEFEDFVKLMRREDIDADENDDLKNAFEMFQVDKGCGCITPKGLQNMFNRLGDAKSYDECVSMIRVFDLDGNGVLDFHEFLKMMIST
ncbi:PREDICTED: probable calcium-binding protein CML41 [Fragaria vesca subsp. vesca]|uniref:probable calcium-binding protein CML41 n=1 Tax=Fragaria vesca subsp. vesca TaxID=101020 RepID=UPI0002C369CB|nr:PREDICTED: probable calcium-binding protein CML41 [Fragaria vesca subsp. vesca]